MVEVDGLDKRYRWYSVALKKNKATVSFIIRGLTRAEQRKKEIKKDAETYVLNCCVVGKHNWDTEYYGICNSLLNNIYELSGITESAKPFKEAVSWIESPERIIELFSVAFVAGCSFDILDNCDPVDYAKYCVAGRFIFQLMTGKKIDDLIGDTPIPDIPLEGTDFTNVGLEKTEIKSEDPRNGKKEIEQYVWKKPQNTNIQLTNEDIKPARR